MAVREERSSQAAALLDGSGLRIGIVQARWNASVGALALAACKERLLQLGVAEQALEIVSVPGSLEVPLCAQALAQSGRCDALIALGAVIRGDTYHFEIVANESAAGITSVQLETGVPVANGILTTDNEEQALRRAADKGRDCAEVAVEMANLLRRLVTFNR